MELRRIHWIRSAARAKLTWQTTLGEITMETTSIRLPIRNLPEHFDRSRITVILEEIEMALMDDGGVYGRTFADSFTITVEVPTHQLMDTASCLKDLGLI
ncbi:hypothetical protein ABWH93_01305 [Seohaeicola saemankumensis]|uniref:hypothetical protein n=1 Tax=Seohaeicola TaxID=481178 RepID=UPI0035CF2290